MTEFNTIMFSWKCVTPPGVARKSSSRFLLISCWWRAAGAARWEQMEQFLGPLFTQNWVFILTKLATHHVATVKLQDVLKSMVKNTRFIALTHLFCRGYSWKKKQWSWFTLRHLGCRSFESIGCGLWRVCREKMPRTMVFSSYYGGGVLTIVPGEDTPTKKNV